MKLNQSITKTATKDLKQILNIEVFKNLSKKYMQEIGRDTYNNKNQISDIHTPSTVDTTLRRRGSAISKSKRLLSKSKQKIKQNKGVQLKNTIQSTVTMWYKQQNENKQESVKNQQLNSVSNINRKILTDRAVYYGNIQLPYLHSSDAISSLYERSKNNQKISQPLINPSPNINPSILTNIKNLYLYYTCIDSLRQLGTGWSNLKSLTVICSYQLKDLSGLTIFPSLQYLFVSHNNINQISDIMYHSNLRCVDLEDNKLDLIDQIEYLYTINNLQWVDLNKNPITKQKQKYRIICENLGNKLQIQDCDKILDYQLNQIDLDYQIYSYSNMQISNNLIKQINQQILNENIKIGQVWRTVYENKNNQNYQQDKNQPDIQIMTPYNDQSEDQDQYEKVEEELEDSRYDRKNQGLRLRVTPLVQYIGNTMDLGPLKKYFSNKVCPQSSKGEKTQKTDKIQRKGSKLINIQSQSQQLSNMDSQIKTRKFAATQKLKMPQPMTSTSQQKPRLNSVSVKKRLGKLSLSKNLNFASTAAPAFSSIKPKQQLIPQLNNINSSSIGIKFLAKRKLFSKASQQLVK